MREYFQQQWLKTRCEKFEKEVSRTARIVYYTSYKVVPMKTARLEAEAKRIRDKYPELQLSVEDVLGKLYWIFTHTRKKGRNPWS